MVGGAIVEGISWHWIFWLNVPIGLALLPLAARNLTESYGPARSLDLPGVGLASAGMLGLVYGIVRGSELGWTSTTVLTSLIGGAVLMAAFLVWESRAKEPMLPLRFFRSRAFSSVSVVSFSMYFGVFGSIFLLAQFFQVTQGYSPLEAGLRTLPWTAMPMLVAPIAGVLSDRIGSRPLMVDGPDAAVDRDRLAGVDLVAHRALRRPRPPVRAGRHRHGARVRPRRQRGARAVRPQEAGQASGATNAIRELGGVLGVAVLATVFASNGSYASPQAYVDGMTSAAWVGAAVLAVGAVAALMMPGRKRAALRVGRPQVEAAA